MLCLGNLSIENGRIKTVIYVFRRSCIIQKWLPERRNSYFKILSEISSHYYRRVIRRLNIIQVYQIVRLEVPIMTVCAVLLIKMLFNSCETLNAIFHVFGMKRSFWIMLEMYRSVTCDFSNNNRPFFWHSRTPCPPQEIQTMIFLN